MNETARELDAVLQRLLDGALPVEEIVCEILDLIEDEGATDAFEALWADQLLGEAKGLDRRAKEGEAHGLLHGVPFAVDSTVSVAKGLDELGTQRVRSTDRGRDAALLEPLRAAGALILGRAGDGPLAAWQSLPGVLGTPKDSLRGGHFTPTRGLISNVGLSLERPSFDVPCITAASLDLVERCAAVLGIAPYAPRGESPRLVVTTEAERLLPSGRVARPASLAVPINEWLDGVERLQRFETQAAAVALDRDLPAGELREAYDVVTSVRDRVESSLAAGDVLVAPAAGHPWRTLGLPVSCVGRWAAVGRRFEDAAVLSAARSLTDALRE